jgi:hypothetical protein
MSFIKTYPAGSYTMDDDLINMLIDLNVTQVEIYGRIA